MRRKLLFALVLLNCLLGIALFASSTGAQIIPRAPFSCCQGAGPAGYCCSGCCWFPPFCLTDEGCRKTE